jgi:hypothetical protein
VAIEEFDASTLQPFEFRAVVRSVGCMMALAMRPLLGWVDKGYKMVPETMFMKASTNHQFNTLLHLDILQSIKSCSYSIQHLSSNPTLLNKSPTMPSYTSSKPSTSSNPSISQTFSSTYQNEAPNMSMTTNPDFAFAFPATPAYIPKKSKAAKPTYTSEKSQYTSDTASIASMSSAKTLVGKVFGRKCKTTYRLPMMVFMADVNTASESSKTTRSKSEKGTEGAENEAKHAARASYFSTL